MNAWITLAASMPPRDVHVLLAWGGMNWVDIAAWDGDGWYDRDEADCAFDEPPTHWMPLPKAPA